MFLSFFIAVSPFNVYPIRGRAPDQGVPGSRPGRVAVRFGLEQVVDVGLSSTDCDDGYVSTVMIHLEVEDYHTNQTTNDDVSIESVWHRLNCNR